MEADLITQEELKYWLHYDPETGQFTRVNSVQKKRAGRRVGFLSVGYIEMMINRKTYRANALAWLYVHGKWPDGNMQHINGDRADNRIANLRDVPSRQISRDQTKAHPGNISGLIGVAWHKASNKWRAMITINGRPKYIGIYADKYQAYAAYLDAKKRFHPESKLAQCQ